MGPRSSPALVLVWLLAGCAGTSAETGGNAPEAKGTGTQPDPGKAADAPAKPGEKPAPPPPPEMPPPASLAEGDRWFVSLRPPDGPEPLAERHRRSRAGGILREEVTWGRSFADVAAAAHGTAQVFAVLLDGKGLSVALLDEAGKVAGDPRVEVAAPYRVGNAWTVDAGNGAAFQARIEALEEVETPAGKVKALRVRVAGTRRPESMTTWYDAGLRPVRAEVRRTATGEVLEARAALASAEPTPEECRTALEWAKKNLGK